MLDVNAGRFLCSSARYNLSPNNLAVLTLKYEPVPFTPLTRPWLQEYPEINKYKLYRFAYDELHQKLSSQGISEMPEIFGSIKETKTDDLCTVRHYWHSVLDGETTVYSYDHEDKYFYMEDLYYKDGIARPLGVADEVVTHYIVDTFCWQKLDDGSSDVGFDEIRNEYFGAPVYTSKRTGTRDYNIIPIDASDYSGCRLDTCVGQISSSEDTQRDPFAVLNGSDYAYVSDGAYGGSFVSTQIGTNFVYRSYIPKPVLYFKSMPRDGDNYSFYYWGTQGLKSCFKDGQNSGCIDGQYLIGKNLFGVSASGNIVKLVRSGDSYQVQTLKSIPGSFGLSFDEIFDVAISGEDNDKILKYVSGNGQQGYICQTLGDPFTVSADGNFQSDNPVNWQITESPDGSDPGIIQSTTTCTSTGVLSSAYLKLGSLPGTYTTEAQCAECTQGSPQVFTATAICPEVPLYRQTDYPDTPYDTWCKVVDDSGKVVKSTTCQDSNGVFPPDYIQYTIAEKGCALTSLAMVMGRYGSLATPDVWNNFLNQINGYDKGNINWNMPPTI